MIKINISVPVLVFLIVFSTLPKSQTLPGAIYNTNEVSEDLFDYACSQNHRSVKQKVAELNKLYTHYRSVFRKDKLSPQFLDFYSFFITEINKALKAGNYKEIAFAANQITGIGSALDNRFKTKIPGEIARLDYLGRELLLESESKNVKAVDRRLEDIDYIWNTIKPVILKKHGRKQSVVFENLVSQIKKGKDNPVSRDFTLNVEKYLDQIDRLENLF